MQPYAELEVKSQALAHSVLLNHSHSTSHPTLLFSQCHHASKSSHTQPCASVILEEATRKGSPDVFESHTLH